MLTRGGNTARLVAKYRPIVPVLAVAVPVLTTDALTWACSNEAPARQCLVTRGLLPLLAEGSARATDSGAFLFFLIVVRSFFFPYCSVLLFFLIVVRSFFFFLLFGPFFSYCCSVLFFRAFGFCAISSLSFGLSSRRAFDASRRSDGLLPCSTRLGARPAHFLPTPLLPKLEKTKDTTDEILAAALRVAAERRYIARGDCVVALHRMGAASVVKIIDV